MENLPTGRYAGAAFKQHHGEDAKQLISRARVLVNRARMKIRNRGGKGQQLESEYLPDGSVIRCLVIQHLDVPIVRWWIERPGGEPEPERKFFVSEAFPANLVWEPEGFVITPRSKTKATQGWGMPFREKDWTNNDFNPINAGKGTAYNDQHYNWPFGDGAVKQVILNKFEHNKSADHLLDLLWEKLIAFALEKAGDDSDAEAIRKFYEDLRTKIKPSYWPIFFTTEDPIFAFYRGPSKSEPEKEVVVLYGWQYQQFVQIVGAEVDSFSLLKEYEREELKEIIDWRRFEHEVEEVEADEWYCHRPDEKPFSDSFSLELFRLTNAARASAGIDDGKLPLNFPLVTSCATALITANQIKDYRILAHNSDRYDDGYRYAHERLGKSGRFYFFGENLQIQPAGQSPEDEAQAVLDWFMGSTHGHREVTLNDWVRPYKERERFLYQFLAGNLVTTGELQIAHVPDGVVDAQEPPPYNGGTLEFDEPIAGNITAKHFTARDKWVQFGDMSWDDGDGNVVSWKSLRPFRYALLNINSHCALKIAEDRNHLEPTPIENTPDIRFLAGHNLYFRGSRISFDYEKFVVLGAALRKRTESFVAILYDFTQRSVLAVEVPMDVRYSDFTSDYLRCDFTVLQSYQLKDEDYSLSWAHFSQDAERAVFAVVSGDTGYAETFVDTLSGDVNTPYRFCSRVENLYEDAYDGVGVASFGNLEYYNNTPLEVPVAHSSIRHIEFTGNGFEEASRFEPNYIARQTTSNGLEIVHTYTEEGNIYADYRDNELIFARIKLHRYERYVAFSWFAKNEKTLVYIDSNGEETELRVHYADAGSSIGGVAENVELLWCDLRTGEDILHCRMANYYKQDVLKREIKEGNELLWLSEFYARRPFDFSYDGAMHEDHNYYWDQETVTGLKDLAPFVHFERVDGEDSLDWDFLYSSSSGSTHHASQSNSFFFDASVFRGIQTGFERPDSSVLEIMNGGFSGSYTSLETWVWVGLLENVWPTESKGFNATDDVRVNGIYHYANGRVVGGAESFMPWVQKLTTLTGQNFGKYFVHDTYANKVRYNGEYITQVYHPGWLAFVPVHDDFTDRRFGWDFPSVKALEKGEVDGYGGINIGGPREMMSEINSMVYKTEFPEAPETYKYDVAHNELFSAAGLVQEKDHCWLTFSSLNLKELTGVDDLADNLFPLGVI